MITKMIVVKCCGKSELTHVDVEMQIHARERINHNALAHIYAQGWIPATWETVSLQAPHLARVSL